jgi:molecular chaperone GrpE
MNNDHKDIESIENLENLDIAADLAMSSDISAIMAQLEKLQHELAAERLKSEQAMDTALRVKAEAENTRKRSIKDVEHAHKYGLERFLKELVQVLDTFELGLQSVSKVTDETALNFAQAMKMTHGMLLEQMTSFGVTQINPQGEMFDPKVHEALSLQHTNEYAPDTIVNVLQTGFILHERVLRPARVVVAKPQINGN